VFQRNIGTLQVRRPDLRAGPVFPPPDPVHFVPDVTAELARDTISALSVLGTLQAPDAVKAALADRIT